MQHNCHVNDEHTDKEGDKPRKESFCKTFDEETMYLSSVLSTSKHVSIGQWFSMQSMILSALYEKTRDIYLVVLNTIHVWSFTWADDQQIPQHSLWHDSEWSAAPAKNWMINQSAEIRSLWS